MLLIMLPVWILREVQIFEHNIPGTIIFTDRDNRKIRFEFYNNDITRKFKAVVEGISEDGRLTRT